MPKFRDFLNIGSGFSLIPAFACLFFVGCTLPQWRVFQKKVPAPVQQFEVTESQRQAADVIARNYDVPQYLRPLTQALSQSLGMPLKAIVEKTPQLEADVALNALRADNARLRKLVAKQKEWLQANAGKELEGTGFNLFGITSFLGIAGTIALFVFVPGALTTALFVIRRLRSGLQKVAQSVEEFQQDNPKAAEDLKQNYLAVNMDTSHKKLIAREEKYIDRSYIQKRQKEKLTAAELTPTA